MITIKVKYFASLRDTTNTSEEVFKTDAITIDNLHTQLNDKYHFPIDRRYLRVSQNGQYVEGHAKLQNNDTIMLIPPLSGG